MIRTLERWWRSWQQRRASRRLGVALCGKDYALCRAIAPLTAPGPDGPVRQRQPARRLGVALCGKDLDLCRAVAALIYDGHGGLVEVVDRQPDVTLELQRGAVVTLDGVESALERAFLHHLSDLLGTQIVMAHGAVGCNQDPRRMVITVPESRTAAVATAIYRALLSVQETGTW